jgi:hypothetical protein
MIDFSQTVFWCSDQSSVLQLLLFQAPNLRRPCFFEWERIETTLFHIFAIGLTIKVHGNAATGTA